LLDGDADVVQMRSLEDVFLNGQVVAVLVATDVAVGGSGRHFWLPSSHLVKLESGFLLFGSGVLEPDLNNSLLEADFSS
jgi:hypothetical protein